MQDRFAPIAFGLALTLCACVQTPSADQSSGTRGQDLTRPQAKRVLEGSDRLRIIRGIDLLPQFHEAAYREGLIASPRAVQVPEVTNEGRRYFQEIRHKALGIVWVAILPRPARAEVVQVTGITSTGEGTRQVEFTWRYLGLSDVVARYAGQGSAPHSGIAIMRLYDDGWRLETLNVNESGRVPFRYDEARLRAWKDAEARRVEAEHEAELAESARKERERVAKTPARTIASYSFVRTNSGSGSGTLDIYTTTMEVTDVGVILATTTEYKLDPSSPIAKLSVGKNLYLPPKQTGSSATIGYWDIAGFSVEDISCGRGHNTPDGTTDLAIERRNGNKIHVCQDKGERTDVAAAVDVMTKAQREWNEKFPDQVNWLRSSK